jgi:threonine dehydratase
MALPSLDQIREAQALVYRTMMPTPQHTWPLLNERLGTEAWVKHENHTPLGAFKLRSALVYADWLRQTNPSMTGLIAATRGNFGQGAGMAARLLGLKAVIVVPHDNSVEKNRAMVAQGAELIEHGEDFQEALEHARLLARDRGLVMFESFHERLAWGTATYALEFLQGAPPLDIVYVPIGMGSSICGMAAARNALGLTTEIVGVVDSASPACAISFREHKVVPAPARSILADGVACRTPHPDALEILWSNVTRVIEVPESRIAEAMNAFYTDTHNIAEGAGAVSLAAALEERASLRGKRVGIVLTGGNVDRDVFVAALSGAYQPVGQARANIPKTWRPLSIRPAIAVSVAGLRTQPACASSSCLRKMVRWSASPSSPTYSRDILAICTAASLLRCSMRR